MKRGRAVALFAVVALAAAAAGYYYSLSRDSQAMATAAGSLYGARLATPDGRLLSLSQWRGRVLVVNFWATWCAPCREEIPGFVKLQARHGGRGLQFVGIAIDAPEKAAAFAREFGINYPVLIGGIEGLELLRLAGSRQGVLPYTVVLDRGGRILTRHAGGLKEDQLEAILKPLL